MKTDRRLVILNLDLGGALDQVCLMRREIIYYLPGLPTQSPCGLTDG